MSGYISGSIEKYLEDLSGRKIVPGGGSAAALTAALGAALNLMVINFSCGKGGKEDLSEQLRPAKEAQEESLKKLSRYVDRDCEVFTELMAALKEKAPSQEKFREAALVPMEVCGECRLSMDISRKLMDGANMNLVSDIGCAANMIKAAFLSASHNVSVNLKYIKDAEFVGRAEKDIFSIAVEMEEKDREISAMIRRHMAQRGADG